MVKDILQIGDPRLNQKSEEVKVDEISSKSVQELIQDLLSTCNAEKEGTAGLSAVQIGELKRIFVARRLDLKEDTDKNPVWEVMINPVVRIKNAEPSLLWEGCLSIGVGDKKLFGPVERPKTVEVKYLDKDGKESRLIASGYFSHIVQHELDHLNGILFLQYVKNPDNIWLSKALDDYLERYEHYPPIE